LAHHDTPERRSGFCYFSMVVAVVVVHHGDVLSTKLILVRVGFVVDYFGAARNFLRCSWFPRKRKKGKPENNREEVE
jgi:hypothetical protein